MSAASILRWSVPGFLVLAHFASESTSADPVKKQSPNSVKVAAVQISGYDKGEVPRVVAPRLAQAAMRTPAST